MKRATWKLVGVLALATGTVAACGDDDAINTTGSDVREMTGTAWASFETDFERMVDEARTGANAAQDDLLRRCRDVLEDLRASGDPLAERVEPICDGIRDADGEAAWDDLREEIEAINGN